MLSQQNMLEPLEMEIVPAEIEIVLIEDLLLPPGRYGRPSKIVVILRGLPGTGKSHLARLIMVRSKELIHFYSNLTTMFVFFFFRKRKF